MQDVALFFFAKSAKLSCRSQKMLKNAYLFPKIGADRTENERNFAKKEGDLDRSGGRGGDLERLLVEV